MKNASSTSEFAEQGSLKMRIALYQPDIPQNTGTIVRLAACLDVPVEIIGPAGFDASDRGFRRAGLDYINQGQITRHVSFAAFEKDLELNNRRLILLSSAAEKAYTRFEFSPSDCLLFGRESAGVPEEIHRKADVRLTIPMVAGLRSLNLAVSVAMVVGEALRQIDGFPAGNVE